MTLGQAKVTEVSDEAMRFDIPVEFTNPNADELELREFRYTVTVNGRVAYSGRRAAQATLPGHGSNHAELPAVVPRDKPSGSASAYSITGSLTYIAPGQIAELLFDTGVRKPTVGFSGQGQVTTGQ